MSRSIANFANRALLFAALMTVPGLAAAQNTSVDDIRDRVRGGGNEDDTRATEQLNNFRESSERRKQEILAQARARRDRLQEESESLEKTARENKLAFEDRVRELKEELGPTSAMFGILQEIASELISEFRNSSTSIQFPDRVEWLESFISRMERSSQIFTIGEIERLWGLIRQEIEASGKIVRLETEVLAGTGGREQREMVRIGKFNLISDEPEPAYLTWQSESQRVSVLKRQPSGGFLDQVEGYIANEGGVHAVGIDPTGGSLLTRLVDAPSLGDRIDQGGLIGYLILTLGAFGVLVAVYKLIEITLINAKVARQREDLDNPSEQNPLGRMLRIYQANRLTDTETLEMRLGEAILEERPKIDRFVGLIKVIAAVAPLMGLMGTVLGMIATFQAITLFGTGDPKTMAGGISQALVTTVLGLTVAIPTVLLHAIVSARAGSVVNTLKHQATGLIAERMEASRGGSVGPAGG